MAKGQVEPAKRWGVVTWKDRDTKAVYETFLAEPDEAGPIAMQNLAGVFYSLDHRDGLFMVPAENFLTYTEKQRGQLPTSRAEVTPPLW